MITVLGIFIGFASVILLYIYISDKDLKSVAYFSIKDVKFITLTKCKYLFVYHKRKEGIITKHAFLCTIANYIINGTIIIALLVSIIINSEALFENGHYFVITIFVLNVALIMAVISQPNLSPEQRKSFTKQKFELTIAEATIKEEKRAAKREEKRNANK